MSIKYALLTLLEKKDTLVYIEGPQLEQEYMSKIGSYEEKVIREEMECELLDEKQQMIQAAINRREPVDEVAIDAKIEEMRENLLKEAQGTSLSDESGSLSAEIISQLQELYREIVNQFHPATHPNLTDVQKELFQKAQDAYRMRNL